MGDDQNSFTDHMALYDYCECHDLSYHWENTAGWRKRIGVLQPDQYRIVPVATRKGERRTIVYSTENTAGRLQSDQYRIVTVPTRKGERRAVLYSKEILRAERKAKEERRDHLAARRRATGK